MSANTDQMTAKDVSLATQGLLKGGEVRIRTESAGAFIGAVWSNESTDEIRLVDRTGQRKTLYQPNRNTPWRLARVDYRNGMFARTGSSRVTAIEKLY